MVYKLPRAGHHAEGPFCLLSSHIKIQRGGLDAQATVQAWGLLAFPPYGCLAALTRGGARLSLSLSLQCATALLTVAMGQPEEPTTCASALLSVPLALSPAAGWGQRTLEQQAGQL